MIYKTKREKYNAVIDEIQKLVKEGRPVLVGTTSVEISELLSRMLTRKGIPHNVLNAKLHFKEAQIVREAGQAGTVTIATNMAGRGTDIKLGPGVKEAGGLAIIGTERHESRRVDRQLRGRSGRQGDPGSSQFYVSLEDDLMRMFGSERIAPLMDRMGLKEGEVIQHPMITKQIEKAQKKVEENHFGVRKHLLEYDDVMNSQRTVIYSKRHHALFGERLSIDINNMMYDLGEKLLLDAREAKDYEGLKMDLLSTMGIDVPFDEVEFDRSKSDVLAQKIFETALEHYREKSRIIGEKTMPVIKNVYERETHFENIAIPITDGKPGMNVIVNLKKAVENGAREVTLSIEKSITLGLIDNAWKEHLRELDDLKESVQNATYEQKDPLVIYKLESFNLFSAMIEKINEEVISFLMRADIPVQDADNVREHRARGIDRSKIKEQRNDLLSQAHSNTQQKEITQPIRVEKKVGRNDPCPCGSGKKYKNCHGKLEGGAE
jgi:preprotein translocase subunit SecA